MAVLARSSTASEPMRLLLLALLACAAAGASVCDMVNCGRGNCAESHPKLSFNGPKIPAYECHCDPGWSHASDFAPMSPCMVPNCSFDRACLNLSMTASTPTDVCSLVTCGAGGACKSDDANFLNYSCECQPGYANLLNLTALPCAKNNCSFAKGGCSPLGIAPAPAPASQPLPPPTANDRDSSGASAPPAGTKGSIPSRRLLQLLLLVTLAMAQLI